MAIRQHNGAGVGSVSVHPSVYRFEYLPVRLIVSDGELFIPTGVAVHLEEGHVLLSGLAEEGLEERRRPVDPNGTALALLVRNEVQLVHDQHLGSERRRPAAQRDGHGLHPISRKEVLAQDSVMLGRQPEPDVVHATCRSSRSSHSSTSRRCVSMQSDPRHHG